MCVEFIIKPRADLGGGEQGVGSPPFPKWFPPPLFEEIIPMKLNFIIRQLKNVFCQYFYNIALQNTDFGVLQKSSKRFLISIFFTSGQGGHPPPCPRRGSRGGGGKGAPPPPPIFWGKNKGAKNHTHRKKRIKIGQPRSKIQAKTYPKTH